MVDWCGVRLLSRRAPTCSIPSPTIYPEIFCRAANLMSARLPADTASVELSFSQFRSPRTLRRQPLAT